MPRRAPVRLESSSCTSGGIRRIVGCGLDADSHRGTIQGQAVRRRPASLEYVTSYLKSMSELARNTEALKKKEVERGRRRLHQPVPERSCQGNKRENSARRRRTSRPQMPEPSESMHGRRKLKELPMHPIVQSLEASWGSFG